MGHPAYVRSRLAAVSERHDQLIEQILSVSDLQCAWILRLHCAVAGGASWPESEVRGPSRCVSSQGSEPTRVSTTDPHVLGCRQPPFLTKRFGVAQCRLDHKRSILVELGQAWQARFCTNCHTGTQLVPMLPQRCGTGGVDALGFRGSVVGECDSRSETAVPVVEDRQIGMPLFGWQQAATDAVHTHVVESTVRPRLNPTEEAMLRSQGGPLSGVPFQCFPSNVVSRFDSSQFHILLLRRLWLPLPSSSRSCRCGRPLDVLGHHRAACAEAGVVGPRGMHWSRQPRGFAVRQGPGWAPTSLSAT